LGACHNSISGVVGIFLAKKSFQSSKFSEGISFTWPLFSHFEWVPAKFRSVGWPTDLNLAGVYFIREYFSNNSTASGQQNTNFA
jgi:hypothetical protein